MVLFVWLYGNILVFLRSQSEPEIIMRGDVICPVPGLLKLIKPWHSEGEM